ncbi:hypothetical protein NDU88_004467 [Pleurodeles waltl]|uniref:Uncharacterized protein n=1 Tax=Pleurodeles waltl TaxID=8319 RepID=A0AAV7UFR5_PLEWA|nr:hypothetical protein NDU88_004467 [Pleurodeles waltl]
MLNNIPRPDQTVVAARPGPRRKRDADAHPARSRAVRRSQRLHPARRYVLDTPHSRVDRIWGRRGGEGTQRILLNNTHC